MGEFAVWIITENGERLRLTDSFKPTVYVSGKEEGLERLAARLPYDRTVVSWDFVRKRAKATDIEESSVLEVVLEDCRGLSSFTRRVLKSGKYLQYDVFNCDLKHEQLYFYNRDVFPLALVEVESKNGRLKYSLLDYAESVDYMVPPLRIARINVEVAKQGKIVKISDPVKKIVVNQDGGGEVVDSGDEECKLLRFVQVIRKLDPDIIVTKGGDSYLFVYLVQRAVINGVLEKLVLGREDTPLVAKNVRGRTFFSYGRTFYRAPARRLFGRVQRARARAARRRQGRLRLRA
jgi:DNA polymerase elongation subunit (family B)